MRTCDEWLAALVIDRSASDFFLIERFENNITAWIYRLTELSSSFRDHKEPVC